MDCPHCRVAIHVEWKTNVLDIEVTERGTNQPLGWQTRYAKCPACAEAIIALNPGRLINGRLVAQQTYLVWPRSSERPCPKEVPRDIADDFKEAVAVLATSPKASAALSRRCLQQVLVQYQSAEGRDLQKQIDDFIAKKHPPAYISDQLHAVRQIGNFGAHTQKDEATGVILPVEPGEAEWNLEVLESLFDFTFVQPALAQERKDRLNQKLEAAGKPKL
jgi:hypothetical protein